MRHTFVFSFAVAVSILVTSPAAFGSTLFSEGEAHMTITYPDQSNHKERAAANRLKSFLARMTDSDGPPIAALSEVPAGRARILIGPTAARTVGIDIAQVYPGDERVVVKTVGKDVVLAGNDAQNFKGTRYAVDMFLAELGSECFGPDPDWHVVPKRDELVFDEITIDVVPAFEFRSTFFFQHPWKGSDPDFDGPSWGQGGVKLHMRHNYENFVPITLGEKHPEYFALVDGQRAPTRGAQICFSNPEVVRRAVAAARGHFDNDPSQLTISLSANDSAGFCECPECAKLGDNPGGQTLSFGNAVLKELRKTHPDKDVATYAYYATEDAPKWAKGEPGVQVIMINSSCRSHSQDNADCPTKQSWKSNLDTWRAHANVTGIREYYMTAWGGRKHVPAILGDAALRDLRYYRDLGLTKMYYEGVEQATIEDSPIQWALHYVVAKGLWNPDQTAEQILGPACEKLFGAAAEPMLAFYLECARAEEACQKHGSMWGLPPPAHAYTPEVVNTIRELLGKALSATAGEPIEVTRRVLDVIECWTRTEERLVEVPPEKEGPKTIADAINGKPGVRIGSDATMTVPTLPGKTIPGGDCAFTFFYLGTVAKHEGTLSGLAGWGNAAHMGKASLFEIEGGRLDWATGWEEDAITAAGSFNEHFDRPVILCVRKRPGPVNETTDIWINGDAKPLGEKSSSRTPNIVSGSVTMGGTYFGGDMTVGEVILFDSALTDTQTHAVGSYLAEKFRLSYAGGTTSRVPSEVEGLCAWFKLAPQARPQGADAVTVHKDDFSRYADDTQLRDGLGPLSWTRVSHGGGEQQLKVRNGIVQQYRASTWSSGAFATTPLHQGERYARVQTDVKYSANFNVHRAGVFLNAVNWERADIGKYGGKNNYGATISTEGYFTLYGQSDASGKSFSSGRLHSTEPLAFDTWYTLVLEARYDVNKVTLDVTVRKPGNGQVLGTFNYVDTEVLLNGGAAGLKLYEMEDADVRLDNFELQFVD